MATGRSRGYLVLLAAGTPLWARRGCGASGYTLKAPTVFWMSGREIMCARVSSAERGGCLSDGGDEC